MIETMKDIYKDLDQVFSNSKCVICGAFHAWNIPCNPCDLKTKIAQQRYEIERLKGNIDSLHQEISARKGG